jgi:hypothetical protein
MLSVGCQRILQALTDRCRLGHGPLACQEMAALFGMDAVQSRAADPNREITETA